MMVLAVDAGGTHCRMALITKDKTETVSSGAANASTDIEATAKSIRAALALLANKTSLSISQLNETPAYLGVAGVTESGVAQSLAVRLAFRQVRIEGDRQSVLRGALGTMDGCIAHCGTGSFFARQKNVVAQFAGGWGPTLDDVASAHWVGIRALRSTLYAHDELTPQTNLTRSLLSDFGSTSAIVAHARDASVSDIAALAKIVTGPKRLYRYSNYATGCEHNRRTVNATRFHRKRCRMPHRWIGSTLQNLPHITITKKPDKFDR